MKIISLLENTSRRDDMITEHGLSLYIETEKNKILFDMGQSDAFYKNAEVVGIDLAKVDFAVLSHGHYDHGGGLAKFLEINTHAPVYMRRDAFLPHYNGKGKYIGLDTSLGGNERIIFTDNIGNEYRIAENITLYSCNKQERKHTFGTFGLTEKVGDGFIDDDFRHEHYLEIKNAGKEKKSVLISGCSHKGILNITEWFSPDVIVGGFHFSKMPCDDGLSEIAEIMSFYQVEYYTCHCTGTEQFEFMKNKMKNLHYLACGESILI